MQQFLFANVIPGSALLQPWMQAHFQLWANLLAGLVVTSLWQGFALVLLTACALCLLPALSPFTRSAIWTGSLSLAVICPALLLIPAHGHGHATHPALWHAGQRASLAVVELWLLAAAFRLTQLTAAALHLRRLLRSAEPVAPAAELRALLDACPRQVQLCTSREVDRPSVAGFLRPRILLPQELFNALTPGELHQIVLHECEHLRRGDDWVNLFGQLSLAVFPLNPALVWVNRRLALERELACDDGVLRSTGARKAYAACLARVAESSLLQRGFSLAIGVLGGFRTLGPHRATRGATRRAKSSELTLRVERILGTPLGVPGVLQTRLATIAVSAVLLGGTALLAHSPELISFAPAGNAASAANTPPDLPRDLPLVPVLQRLSAGSMAHPMLTNAVMRPLVSQPAMALKSSSPVRRIHSTQVSHKRPVTPATPPLVRVGWYSRRVPAAVPATSVKVEPEAPALQVVPVLLRMIPVSLQGSQLWYTAVPFRGGWIVVQL